MIFYVSVCYEGWAGLTR